MSTIVAVSAGARHDFSKPNRASIRLTAGLGVEGDAHLGVTVKHRSRVRIDPTQPNLRQVHLISAELQRGWAEAGFRVAPGALGENLTTEGLDLMALPTGTILRLGAEAAIEITGLRNPCAQIDAFMPGLLAETLRQGADGSVRRQAGIMAVVLASGDVRPGDGIAVVLPPLPHKPLERV